MTAITGSSGSGAQPSPKTHHPERHDSLAAYSVLSHRHVPEIETALRQASSGELETAVELVPLSGPFSRGIFASSFVALRDGQLNVSQLYEEFAGERTFIRIRKESPRLIDVRGSNFCDIAVHQKREEAVVISALDNLVKGAAGNAVQCMNIMFGLEEEVGLMSPPLCP